MDGLPGDVARCRQQQLLFVWVHCGCVWDGRLPQRLQVVVEKDGGCKWEQVLRLVGLREV